MKKKRPSQNKTDAAGGLDRRCDDIFREFGGILLTGYSGGLSGKHLCSPGHPLDGSLKVSRGVAERVHLSEIPHHGDRLTDEGVAKNFATTVPRANRLTIIR